MGNDMVVSPNDSVDGLFPCTERETRITCIAERINAAPTLSPARTIEEAGTGAWNDPGGGESRKRYASSTSMRAAGKGSWGARR